MTVLYSDNDPHAAQWMRNLIEAGLISKGDVDETDIRELEPERLRGVRRFHAFAGIGGWDYALRLAGWPEEREVWTGSCPCQPFSAAGKAAGVCDERHLWPAFRDLIAERRPQSVVGEQVAGADGKYWMAGVRADLEALGYAVWTARLDARIVGARQKRVRFYWAASDATRFFGRPYDCVVQGGERRASWEPGGLPRVVVSGRWWQEDERTARMPTLVRNYHGLSRTLRGIGNAIVPQVAALFVRAFMEAVDGNLSDGRS